MNLELIRDTLGWCTVINLGVLLWWFFLITFAKNWVYRMHTKFFDISHEQFNGIHYSGLGLYKLMTFFFNIVPYLALRITLS